ncbi:hypothetical protein AVEN_107930-1 [Araneus ventricosus]|uniref:Uncharacterized protein n=1 Tax=Araneus ventricosus TaxID=182803 RepID=A0A4Y2KZ52_ARAVE|nr:hypothetical protein AVEN_107930-1 [Araneus ventricosus]
MQMEEYEDWMSIDEDIHTATLTDLGICQAVCEQDQVIKVDDSDWDECVEENPPTNAEMRQALDILKRGIAPMAPTVLLVNDDFRYANTSCPKLLRLIDALL